MKVKLIDCEIGSYVGIVCDSTPLAVEWGTVAAHNVGGSTLLMRDDGMPMKAYSQELVYVKSKPDVQTNALPEKRQIKPNARTHFDI